MQDRVAEVFAQRASLDRGAGTAVALSLLLHGGLTALAVYAATHATAPKPATMVNIQFASMRPAAAARAPMKAPAAATLQEPRPVAPVKPSIQEPKPEAKTSPAKAEKNTVPFSPFGRSTKRGSETPAVAPTPAAPAAAVGGMAGADVPIGGSGVTGLEGGDFPYSLYISGMQRKIGSNWFRPGVTDGTSTTIYFRIVRDGTVTEARVETPSGNAAFDRAALSAVRSSTPMNPLPYGYSGTYLGVHLTFR